MTIKSLLNGFKDKFNRKSPNNSHQNVVHPIVIPQQKQAMVISAPIPSAIFQEDEYSRGLQYYKEGDMRNALQHFEGAYEHPEALYRMAKLYEQGVENVINADISIALKLYGAAAKAGNIKAKYCLGRLYQNGSVGLEADIIEAIKWYNEAGSYSKAQCKLGDIYLYGLGIRDRNESLALEYYTNAAMNRSTEAKFKLASLYISGKEDIPRNPFLAKILFKSVVKSKHKKYAADAQLALGNLYQIGESEFPKNMEKAREYYLQASENHHTAAYTCYAETLLLRDFDIIKNATEALPYLKKAIASSELNELNAKSLLGLFYQLGWPLDNTLSPIQRAEVAKEWHVKATEGNKNTFSNLWLGLLYAEGDVPSDGDPMDDAEYYFSKCAKVSDEYENPRSHDGHANYLLNFNDTIHYLEALAQHLAEDDANSIAAKKKIYTFLAILYERGLINTEINITKALIYYKQAGRLGGTYATNKLKSLEGLSEIDAKLQLIQAQTTRANNNIYVLRDKLRKEQKENRSQQFQIDHLYNAMKKKCEQLRSKRDDFDNEASQFVSQSTNLRLFHQVIRSRLEAIFISVISAAGGFTKVEDGKIASVNTVIELFGDIVSAVPITAPFGPLVKWGINKPLDALDKEREKNKVINISDKMTVASAQTFAANFALQLTKRYADQINLLATPEQEKSLLPNLLNCPQRVIQKGKDKLKKLTIKKRHLAPAEKLAAYALVWCLDNILSFPDQQNADSLPLDQYLLEKIEDVPSNDVKTFWNKVTSLFHSKENILSSKGTWLDPLDVYTRPGIETPYGYRYIGDSSNPVDFKWRRGSIIEVQRKHMRYVGQENPLKPPPYSSTNYDQHGLFRNIQNSNRAAVLQQQVPNNQLAIEVVAPAAAR